MSTEPTHTLYLLLGSNMQPQEHLCAAVRELARYGRIRAVSSVWESKPVGFLDQPNFLNAAVMLETPLSLEAFRRQSVVEIERKLHRIRHPHNVNAPRTIDIDVVLFNRERRIDAEHKIPDPAILQHAFVAKPLAEIDPDYIHPETGGTLAEIAASFDDGSGEIWPRPDVVLPGGKAWYEKGRE